MDTQVTMSQKCALCKEELKNSFMEKVEGTVIKTGTGETSKKYWVCTACQKENKDQLKEKVAKLK
jgi:uncharacterized protein with PIN domain